MGWEKSLDAVLETILTIGPILQPTLIEVIKRAGVSNNQNEDRSQAMNIGTQRSSSKGRFYDVVDLCDALQGHQNSEVC